MGISMADYGLAVYNAEGMNVLSSHLFCPKLIASLTFRQRQLQPRGDLTVVAQDGREIGLEDASLNIPLSQLRAGGLTNFMRDRGRQGRFPLRSFGGDMLTEYTYRYEFSLYGEDGRNPGLLPAVIHGWGNGYDEEKWSKAERLVGSVVSGQDWQLAQVLKKSRFGDNAAEFPKYQLKGFKDHSGLQAIHTGLPVTLTFRSTSLPSAHPTSLDGFGLVACTGGRLYVEMAANTEITIHFYELAGIPWEYFAQCSTVEAPPSYGLVVYGYDPTPVKYVMTSGDSVDMFGNPRASALEMGNIPRAQYKFIGGTTLYELVQSVGQDDTAAKRSFAQLFEGDPDKPLRYELMNSARPYLRLLSNLGGIRKGTAITVQDIPGQVKGCIYTVTGGHDYAKVCSPMAHGTAGQYKLPGGGLMTALGGATSHSMFERSLANKPLHINAPKVPDDYAGAPWNRTIQMRMSDVHKALGWDFYAPQYNMSKDEMLGSPTVLDRVGDWVYRNTWNLQRAANLIFKRNPVVMNMPNPDYSPKDAMKREQQIRDYKEAFREAEAQREFETNGGWDVDAQKEIQRETAYIQGMLDLVDNVLDSELESSSDFHPFWANHGFRHSDDKIEVYKYISLKQSQSAPQAYSPPEYVPENWIFCRLPV